MLQVSTGPVVYTNVPKNLVSSYAVGAAPSLFGVVIGFTGGLSCTFQEADGNMISVPSNTVVAT